ncbi:MAG: hypothetical protein WC475_03385 [Candidatus Paceibacterota bacterium]
MAIELKVYHEVDSTPNEESGFYKIDGIDGGKKSATVRGLEKIFNEFIKEKKDFIIEVFNQIPIVEDPRITTIVRRLDKDNTEVYRVLKPGEIPESMRKYLKEAI